jgi:hypothetical protein
MIRSNHHRCRPGPLTHVALCLASVCLLPLRAGAQAPESSATRSGAPSLFPGQGQAPAPGPSRSNAPSLFPGRERAFRLESEVQLKDRMAREGLAGENPFGLKYEIFFPSSLPNYPTLPSGPLPVRQWEPLAEIVPPPYVCYNRLYFQQLNMERYGWDLGVWSPLASVAAFYVDLFALPYHAATEPLRRYECNTGYCLPGDPVPLLLYPPELSLTGALGEAAVIGLAAVFFP